MSSRPAPMDSRALRYVLLKRMIQDTYQVSFA